MTAVISTARTSPEDAADIGDPELVKLVQSLPRDSEERNAACEKLIGRYESLVRACAQRYRHSPESRARSSGTSGTSGGTCTSSAPPRNCAWSCAGPAPT